MTSDPRDPADGSGRAPPSGDATAGCLDEDHIAALADGALGPAEREHAMAHLSHCARCRAAVADVARAISDAAIAREAAFVEAPRNRRWQWGTLGVGAVAAVLLLLVRPDPVAERPVPDAHRATSITNGTAPSPTSPVGLVADAGALRWATVPGADRYRVILFSATGEVLYEMETTGTVVTLPDSVRLSARARYLWKVEARTGFDRWTSSELVEFSIAAREPR